MQIKFHTFAYLSEFRLEHAHNILCAGNRMMTQSFLKQKTNVAYTASYMMTLPPSCPLLILCCCSCCKVNHCKLAEITKLQREMGKPNIKDMYQAGTYQDNHCQLSVVRKAKIEESVGC